MTMPNVVDKERTELDIYPKSVEGNKELSDLQSFQEMETNWKQNQQYYQDRFLYSDCLRHCA